MKTRKIIAYTFTLFATVSCQSDNNHIIKHEVIISENKSTQSANKCEPQGSVLVADRLRVIDGDTVEVIPANGQPERIRLVGIDAPEYNQPFGDVSTQALIECVTDSSVKVLWEDQDRYKRLLGTVFANGKDCNLNQIKEGVAWHYKQYQATQSEYDRIAYSNAEVKARLNQKGLWSAETVTAPWDFRRNDRPEYKFNNTIYDLNEAGCTKDGIQPTDHQFLY